MCTTAAEVEKLGVARKFSIVNKRIGRKFQYGYMKDIHEEDIAIIAKSLNSHTVLASMNEIKNAKKTNGKVIAYEFDTENGLSCC